MGNAILLMTRPQAASRAFLHQLNMPDLDVIESPLMQIVPTQTNPQLADGAGVIFTSSNGVKFSPTGQGRQAYCVGARTAKDAQDRGWQVQIAAQDAKELVGAVIGRDPKGALLHIAGEHRQGDIAQQLNAAGVKTEVHIAYHQPLLPISKHAQDALTGEVPVIVPLFSARSAAQFATQAVGASNVRILAMSAAVADALNGAFAGNVHIAKAPTSNEMLRGVENLLLGHRSP